MREREILEHIADFSKGLLAQAGATRRAQGTDAHVLVGPGDDCAVVRIGASPPLLLKVDQLIEGRHFTSETPMELIAHKAIARAVSDIAAMAGTPVCSLVGAVLPAEFPQERAVALCDAIHRAGLLLGAPVVGGDTATYAPQAPLATRAALPSQPFALNVSAVGTAHAQRGPVLRSGAQAGDEVFVTGCIGGSFTPLPTREHAFPGGGRHLTFSPRVDEARALADLLGASLHAMTDISDGLGMDASRLARASRVAITLDERLIPLAPNQPDVLRALADGEDFELLFTAAPGSLVATSVAGTPVTRIGTVAAGTGCTLLRPTGTRVDTSHLGWEHGRD